MAIGTPVAIGNGTAGNTTTVAVTTTGAASAGSLVILTLGWGASPARTISTISGGGLTWATDHSQPYTGVIEWGFAVISAQAPSGLASSTTITVTMSGACYGKLLAATYCTGLSQTSPGVEDISDGQGQASVTAWDTSATTTTVADTLVIGGCICDGAQTNTASGGAAELHDFQFATESWSACDEYKILSATASTNLTGTWTGGNSEKTSAFVAYKADSAAAAVIPDIGMAPLQRKVGG